MQGSRIVKRLLHAMAGTEGALLGLDQSKRDLLVIQHEIGFLGFAPAYQFAPHDDPAFGERDLSANPGLFIPSGFNQGFGDELDADVVFAEMVCVHKFPNPDGCISTRLQRGISAENIAPCMRCRQC
jgi:hypothetical protein